MIPTWVGDGERPTPKSRPLARSMCPRQLIRRANRNCLGPTALQSVGAPLSGADPDDLVDGEDPDLSVSDLPRCCRVHYRVGDVVHLGIVLMFVSNAFIGALNAIDRQLTFTWAALVSMVVNIALNLALIPRFGYLGASWALPGVFLFIILVLIVRPNGLFGMAEARRL